MSSDFLKLPILEDYGKWCQAEHEKFIPDFFSTVLEKQSAINAIRESNIPLNKIYEDWEFKLTTPKNKKSKNTLDKIKGRSFEFMEKGLCAYIYGDTGTGKTSYCIEIMKYFIRDVLEQIPQSFEGKTAPFIINCRVFNDYVNDRRHPIGDIDGLVNRMKQSCLLVLDDMSFIERHTTAFNRLYEVVEFRANHEISTLFTSNLTPEKFKEVYKGEEAFISRVIGRCREAHLIPLVGIDMRNK